MKRGSRCVPPPHGFYGASRLSRWCRRSTVSAGKANQAFRSQTWTASRSFCAEVAKCRADVVARSRQTEDCRSHRSRRDGAEAGGVRVGLAVAPKSLATNDVVVRTISRSQDDPLHRIEVATGAARRRAAVIAHVRGNGCRRLSRSDQSLLTQGGQSSLRCVDVIGSRRRMP